MWGLCGSLLAFPCLRVGALLACGVYGASSLRSLQSRLPFVVIPPFHVSVCPSPALAVGWFSHRSVAPPAAPVCWALVGSLLRRYVALAYGRTLSFCCFSPGFLPLAFVRTWVGRLRSCLGSCLLLGGGNSPSLVLVVFAWRFLQFGCPGSLSFLELFTGVLSSRFQWLRIVLGYPPSVAWRRKVLPWFSVRDLSACPHGAEVPLGSSVLRCSWSSRWGHLSQVGTVFSPRS